MLVTGVSSSNFFQPTVAQGVQNKFQQIQSQFQQLGVDLQSGNLSQAQVDFAALTKDLPTAQPPSAGGSGTTNAIAQAFKTLGQDLQAGNLSAAQQDFAAILQGAQQKSNHHLSHHRVAVSGQPGGGPIAQAFGALGQALQSGSLSSAQQAYATLQQDLQQYLPNASAGSSGNNVTTASAGGSVSITA
jgi:hypothetical protein